MSGSERSMEGEPSQDVDMIPRQGAGGEGAEPHLATEADHTIDPPSGATRVASAGAYGQRFGSGRLGTLEQVLGAERARPILKSLHESEQRHGEALRVLGRTALGR